MQRAGEPPRRGPRRPRGRRRPAPQFRTGPQALLAIGKRGTPQSIDPDALVRIAVSTSASLLAGGRGACDRCRPMATVVQPQPVSGQFRESPGRNRCAVLAVVDRGYHQMVTAAPGKRRASRCASGHQAPAPPVTRHRVWHRRSAPTAGELATRAPVTPRARRSSRSAGWQDPLSARRPPKLISAGTRRPQAACDPAAVAVTCEAASPGRSGAPPGSAAAHCGYPATSGCPNPAGCATGRSARRPLSAACRFAPAHLAGDLAGRRVWARTMPATEFSSAMAIAAHPESGLRAFDVFLGVRRPGEEGEVRGDAELGGHAFVIFTFCSFLESQAQPEKWEPVFGRVARAARHKGFHASGGDISRQKKGQRWSRKAAKTSS